MDANKLERLKEVGYAVQPSCGLCHHGDFAPGQDFGVCNLWYYMHLKHSESKRKLSINRHGACRTGFVLDSMKEGQLVGWPRLAIPRTEG